MFHEAFSENFSKLGTVLGRNILSAVEAMVRCSSSNTTTISRELCKINNKNFKANDTWLYRLLGHKEFLIDDAMWRCYSNSIFSMLKDQGLIKTGDEILVPVDFTSDRDDFLICASSILIDGLSIPLYFSMRNYPRRKDQMDQKKMELAFMKALRHLLPKKYRYRIIADRGFGNERFISYCSDRGFEYAIRLEPNTKVTVKDNAGKERTGIMAEILDSDGEYDCCIHSWHKEYRVARRSKDGMVWYICLSGSKSPGNEASKVYEKRFSIEKIFQNLKSSGFDIEKSKIKKYSTFKRMLFLSVFAYAISVLVGKFIQDKMPALKKRSPISTNLLIASSSLALPALNSTQKRRIE